MINLIRHVVSNYNEVLNNAKDPMVDTWFLMESPGPILCIISAYLIFVLKIGPKMMKNRPAFQLNTVMIAYNAFQVLFNIWVITLILELDFKYLFFIHGFNNQNSISSNQQLARHIKIMSRGSWWYFVTKVVELLDTVFFVLRRKQNQVTFLHVYHHTLTTLLSWCYLKYLPSVQGVMIALLNSIVHVIMYSYYLIAALGPNYKKYIWWKKYLTWIQLLQFSLILVYLSLTLIMDCRIPKAPSYLFGVIYIIFIYLFGNFYRQAYKKKVT
ncbi:elongation of very long chain fatty acids protein 4 [Solenopsis invicta]|uniref:elongation of very long chain fatty acids protein 4 n=1 Tax=Solenopsis invicta TaxID=13686 RepID=UPI000595F826|nr:elongation of very long chain fatty acids protein 4 [Solenopsis invicta]XP_039314090.1 elongation of very long chain fatty acids protein 4 [Solenopsis invicta]